MNELVEQVALRVRHNAAMDVVTTTPPDRRAELLCDVLLPSRRLHDVSLERARQVLDRRRQAAA